MPLVTVHLLEGRTLDQKRRLVARITDALIEEAGARREMVQVRFLEVSKQDWGRGGLLGIDRSDVIH
ncbi:MAG TPA: 2-hydroxymuconate tautomerase [Actinomycetota bacterium]|nr:2-hydroxymuconate tautomerase [Actinomycetota bacterium]